MRQRIGYFVHVLLLTFLKVRCAWNKQKRSYFSEFGGFYSWRARAPQVSRVPTITAQRGGGGDRRGGGEGVRGEGQ